MRRPLSLGITLWCWRKFVITNDSGHGNVIVTVRITQKVECVQSVGRRSIGHIKFDL